MIPVTRKCTSVVIGVLILCLSYELIIIHYWLSHHSSHAYTNNIIVRAYHNFKMVQLYAVFQIEVFQFQIGSFFFGNSHEHQVNGIQL